MLTITAVATLKLKGELAGFWVDEAAQAWFEITATRPAKDVTVDLSGVRRIDESGKNLLRQMLQGGSQLRDGRLMIRPKAHHPSAPARGEELREARGLARTH